MAEITVVTLGTGDERYLTRETERVLKQARKVILRTERHPISAFLRSEGISFVSLDQLYEKCEDFDAFNQAAAVTLLTELKEGSFCYGVSDPAFDSSIFTLQRLKPREAKIVVLPGVGVADQCLAMAGRRNADVRVFAAAEYVEARVSPEEPLLLCELHSRECASDCKLKLMTLMPEEMTIQLITGDEKTGVLSCAEISLLELDRQKQYDHLTAVYVPAAPLTARTRFDMDDLVHVMNRLRAPDGCPWDKEQTYESLLTNLLEESYEYIQAVRDGDVDHMYDELGDVLLQVVFHAEIARQHGDFDILDVTTAICQKMIERHPHIFGTVQADTSEKVLENWEAIKRKQRGITSTAQAMEDVSTGLSPLMRAAKVQHKAAKVGFDFASPADALSKVYEEADEVKECLEKNWDTEEELGDLFFAAVNVCRLCEKNGDIALFGAIEKFITRFKKMEKSINEAGKCLGDLTLSEMDVYWEAGKRDAR
ncbi:MAG: nucleoside triphosphate pyrophosphohydrolase [Eubacteriales bacterium]|nr:nucleoside triphosphate pyrophosphohydrolase [Eubacteriales bacterium]